ncbi:MAG: AMP-binding protein, partial [Acidimicrobiales bacterium]
YGFSAITLASLVGGAAVVTLPRFEPEAFLSAIEAYRVNRLGVVPPVLQFLASHPLVQGRDLSSLHRVGSGAAPMSAELGDRVAARLGCPVTQGYGMTESSGVVATTPLGQGRRGSSGMLLPGTQMRTVHPETLAEMPAGEPGELWFRGPQAFTGYHRQPEATAATLLPDGWVRTGDIGFVDADGHLFITDRLKELIKVKGFQVAPAELEAVLHGHPAVLDCAVFGVPDEAAGEVPVAAVQLDPDQPVNVEELQRLVADTLANYKQLREVVVVAAIPRLPSGKVLRRVLRDEWAAQPVASGSGH